MTNTTEGAADRPDDLEGRLDDITSEGQGAEQRESPEAEPFHEQQLGGIARTGEGPDLQQPSSAQGGG